MVNVLHLLFTLSQSSSNPLHKHRLANFDGGVPHTLTLSCFHQATWESAFIVRIAACCRRIPFNVVSTFKLPDKTYCCKYTCVGAAYCFVMFDLLFLRCGPWPNIAADLLHCWLHRFRLFDHSKVHVQSYINAPLVNHYSVLTDRVRSVVGGYESV